ncbi:hypothetical protein ES703_104506 [subsurface metagenome]
MPTTRSLYNYKQFSKVFQELAHVLAIEAITDLKPVRITVKTFSSGELSEVEIADLHFRFYFRHLSFSYSPEGSYKHPDYMHFDIEEKFYSTSAHCSKISFFSPEIKENKPDVNSWDQKVDHKKTDAEKNRRQKKIDKFLEKLMQDADMKIEPRFNLQEYSKH